MYKIDTTLLRVTIQKKGYKTLEAFLAEAERNSISRGTLTRIFYQNALPNLHNTYKLAELLKLTDSEIISIFFAK